MRLWPNRPYLTAATLTRERCKTESQPQPRRRCSLTRRRSQNRPPCVPCRLRATCHPCRDETYRLPNAAPPEPLAGADALRRLARPVAARRGTLAIRSATARSAYAGRTRRHPDGCCHCGQTMLHLSSDGIMGGPTQGLPAHCTPLRRIDHARRVIPACGGCGGCGGCHRPRVAGGAVEVAEMRPAGRAASSDVSATAMV
jgi:hypothetical protein